MSDTQMQLRLLDTADLQAWQEIEQACFPDPWSDKQLAGVLKQARNRCYGLFQRNRLQGFAVFATVLDEAELLQIAVSPDFQGKGVAERLFTQAVAQLAAGDTQRVMLEVRASNTPALGLYRKLGFAEDGRRKGYYPAPEGREDAILMSLVLSRVI